MTNRYQEPANQRGNGMELHIMLMSEVLILVCKNRNYKLTDAIAFNECSVCI